MVEEDDADAELDVLNVDGVNEEVLGVEDDDADAELEVFNVEEANEKVLGVEEDGADAGLEVDVIDEDETIGPTLLELEITEANVEITEANDGLPPSTATWLRVASGVGVKLFEASVAERALSVEVDIGTEPLSLDDVEVDDDELED